MRQFVLAAFLRYCPDGFLEIDLIPARTSGFTDARYGLQLKQEHLPQSLGHGLTSSCGDPMDYPKLLAGRIRASSDLILKGTAMRYQKTYI
jgi:hypothetical protein